MNAPPPSDREAAAYIAELSLTLAAMARGHGFDALGRILEMARMEAEEIAHNGRLPPGPASRPTSE